MHRQRQVRAGDSVRHATFPFPGNPVRFAGHGAADATCRKCLIRLAELLASLPFQG